MVMDMNSANGTYVNGTRVTQCALRPGDQIRIGPVTLVFEGATAAPGWRCGRCGRTNAAHDRFCGSCGMGRP
jgi:pSer/pThr/pTyr-binding forkhead associated (FHA) protein